MDRMLADIDDYWTKTYFESTGDPATKLVLVLEGDRP